MLSWIQVGLSSRVYKGEGSAYELINVKFYTL